MACYTVDQELRMTRWNFRAGLEDEVRGGGGWKRRIVVESSRPGATEWLLRSTQKSEVSINAKYGRSGVLEKPDF
jgi:hypothetical protein